MNPLRMVALTCLALASFPSLALAQDPPAVSPALVAPELVQNVEPHYPDAKRASGEAATVSLILTIDEQGQVSDAQVSGSAGSEFDAAALDAAKDLRFVAASRNGRPIAAKIAFKFAFTLAPPSPDATPVDAPELTTPPPATPPLAAPAPAPLP